MDIIFIKNINITTVIGIAPHELDNKQRIIIDLELATNARQAAQSDNIKDTVDYSKIISYISNLCDQHQFNLIETLAEFLAQNILETFKSKWLKLKITKPCALRETQEVGIIIERHQE